MTVNNKILAEDYNVIQRRVASILGVGTQNRGYGQTVRSSPVTASTTVTTVEWQNLYYDIFNIYRKQNNANPSAVQLPLLTSDELYIRSDADATTFRATRSGNNLIVTEVSTGQLAIGQNISGAGVTAGTITGVAAVQTPITISSFGSKTGSEPGPFTVILNIAAQDRAPTREVFYTVAGNSNPKYNGSFRCTASTTTSVTLRYNSDPGTYGTGVTTITITTAPNPYGRTTWTTSSSQTLTTPTTITANRPTVYPVTAYNTLSLSLDQLTNRFLLPVGQFSEVNHGTAETTWPGPYGDTWSNLIQCTVTVTFTTAARARAFFNAGGLIRFLATQSGGSDVVPGNTLPSGAGFTNVPQNTSWRNLLSTAGTRSFGGNEPTQDLGTNNGQNYFRLNDVFQSWYSISGTTPYASNNYVIQARSPGVSNNSNGTARTIEFRIRWEDLHVGTGSPTAGPDVVNGTFTLGVSSYVPGASTGFQPSGGFTTEAPSVTIGAILEPSPN